MDLLLSPLPSLLVLLGGGILSTLSRSFPAGPVAAALGAVLLATPAVAGLASRAFVTSLPWGLPLGEPVLGLDPLSGFFLLVTSLLLAASASYGHGYRQGGHGSGDGAHWFFHNLLAAGLILVFTARDAVLFLVVWEIMSLAAYFLVTTRHREEAVRRAGWIYLISVHAGSSLLLPFFLLLGRGGDGAAGPGTPLALLFLLALGGFGAKAGLVPFHVWLPEAHPAAPSHVSALMSGLMTLAGVYGLLRTVAVLGPPPAAVAWLMAAGGLATALFGAVQAMAEGGLKRALAASTVEHMGLLILACGLGALGLARQDATLAVLATTALLVHALNHALAKGLLFLGAGAVLRARGEDSLDRLGGLLREMPVTGWTFLAGAASLAGAPLLGGFSGEFLLLWSVGLGILAPDRALAMGSVALLLGLGLAGGLAVAAMARVFSFTFLGPPRTPRPPVGDPGPAMRLPLAVMSSLSFLLALLAPLLLGVLAPVVAQVTSLAPDRVARELALPARVLLLVAGLAAATTLLTLLSALLRRTLLAKRPRSMDVTWDCGYHAPTPRMSYSATSFAEPLRRIAGPLAGLAVAGPPPAGPFPLPVHRLPVRTDPAVAYLYRPIFAGVRRAVLLLRWLQGGRIHLYVLYLAVTLLLLLAWHLGTA